MKDKVYVLQNPELGWDNVVAIALTKVGAIKEYTCDEVNLSSEEEADLWVKEHELKIYDRTLRME